VAALFFAEHRANMEGWRRGEKKIRGGLVVELRTSSSRKYFESRAVNACAQCGENIFIPEWSEHLDARRVRHLWECDSCGYVFETLVVFGPPPAG
jgi:predicted RNA-binding Zn-ribbon protein involved in translation (DUF1610 family)